MLEFIHENFTRNISLSDIADVAGISEREALRCFKRTIGESPVQYLVKHRLMQSAYMLLTQPDISVSEVAANCGFDSPAYYAKRFKELYRCAPPGLQETYSQPGHSLNILRFWFTIIRKYPLLFMLFPIF